MKKYEPCKRVSCLCLSLLLALSLAACDKQADEQTSAQPTPSTQPTAAPTPTPTPPPIPYTDVAEDSPYYDAVVWAYKNGIASDGETFGPADVCTRGQVMTFLWRAMGSPEPWIMENPFDDASSDDWYYKPALWAYQHNIATSTPVNPGNPCTSAEALTFLWRAEGKPDKLTTLAASDTYYAQPVAWADKNGLFAGTEFDPTAPCTRADLVTYLHWAVEQWTPSKEEQRIQTEYDKILYGLDIYAGYAGYVDVEGDGSAELLTLKGDYNEVDVSLYAEVDGKIEVSSSMIFWAPNYQGVNLPGDGEIMGNSVFSLYSADGQPYLCHYQTFYNYGNTYEYYDFYKIEKGAITLCEQREKGSSINRETGEEDKWDSGTSLSYAKQTDIFNIEVNSRSQLNVSSLNKGILPGWEECNRYWATYWEASNPIYAAVLSGDFSAIAGNYEGGNYASGEQGLEFEKKVPFAIDKDGTITGDYEASLKAALSVTVRKSGEIYFETEYYEEVEASFGYTIYLSGCAADLPVQNDPSKVRISRNLGTGGQGLAFFSKTS